MSTKSRTIRKISNRDEKECFHSILTQLKLIDLVKYNWLDIIIIDKKKKEIGSIFDFYFLKLYWWTMKRTQQKRKWMASCCTNITNYLSDLFPACSPDINRNNRLITINKECKVDYWSIWEKKTRDEKKSSSSLYIKFSFDDLRSVHRCISCVQSKEMKVIFIIKIRA